MIGESPRVRVVVHDLGRSGVPVVLFRYLEALPAALRDGVSVLAGWDGPLRRDLSALGVRVGVVWSSEHRRAGRLVAPLGGRAAALAVAADVRRAARRLPTPDVVVWHGAGSLQLTGARPEVAASVVHLHELDVALGRSVAPQVLRAELERARTVAVVTPEVGPALERYCGWVGSSVVVPGCADRVDATGREAPTTGAVVGIGAPDWRKGADRLVAVAAELRRRGVSTPVRWIGGRPSGREQWWVGAASVVEWDESTDQPWSRAGSVAVVVVPSREDPLPLVVLEAGARGLPVVAAATGGLPALLAEGRGTVVDAGDLSSLVDAVQEYLGDPAAAAAAGAGLREWIRAGFDPDVVGARWWATVSGSEDSSARPVH